MAKNRLADWDTTAGNNSDVGGINIAEGWAPENVNNAARETMSQLAEFFKDTTGTITSTNVANAYSITTNDGITAYAAGQKYAFIANAANTGAATLNINTIGAKSLVKNHDLALESGDIEANQICLVAYEATDDTFQLLSQMAQVITEGANVDIANTTAETDIDRGADSILVYDDTATANREAVISDCVGPVIMAAQATTSGTAFDFTSIPDWATNITVMFDGVSLSGTNSVLVQPGTIGGPVTSGYEATSARIPSGFLADVIASTAGFLINVDSATFEIRGTLTLHKINGNTWVSSHNARLNASQIASGGGEVDLGAVLTQIRITRSGADTFDAGQVNVAYL